MAMDMTGERLIAAPRQVVWDALNDPVTLKASIPGCETLEKTAENQMKAIAAIKLGPISARFNGAVTLSDIDAPNSYTISGEGQGGVAGFAKGGARVFLSDAMGGTLLKYEVNAQVGGKLAQLGARLIDATAKQMAEQFFTKFSSEVGKLVPVAVAPAGVAPVAVAPVAAAEPVLVRAPPSAVGLTALVPREIFGLPLMGWVGIGAFVLIVLVALGSLLR